MTSGSRNCIFAGNLGISYINANVTSIISVALVLTLLGMGALLGLFAHSATERIQAGIGFDVSMADDATDSQVLAMKRLTKSFMTLW